MKGKLVIKSIILVLLGAILSGCSKKANADSEKIEADQVDATGQYLTYERLDGCEIGKEDCLIGFSDGCTDAYGLETDLGRKEYYMYILCDGGVYFFATNVFLESESVEVSDYVYCGQLSEKQIAYLNSKINEIRVIYEDKPISQSEYYWNYRRYERDVWPIRYCNALPDVGSFWINKNGVCYCVAWTSDNNLGQYINSDEAARKIMMWVMDSDYFQEWEQYKVEENEAN